MFNLPPVLLVEDELDPRGPHVYVNDYDVKQFVNKYGDDACVACELAFTNKGDGMLCPACQSLLRNHMGELE